MDLDAFRTAVFAARAKKALRPRQSVVESRRMEYQNTDAKAVPHYDDDRYLGGGRTLAIVAFLLWSLAVYGF